MNKISVIIPILDFNKKWLQKLIDSCEPFDEIVFVSDNKEFNYLDFDYPESINVVSIVNEKHLGISESLNLAVCKARNEWISFMCADDYFLPEISIAMNITMDDRADVICFSCRNFGEKIFKDETFGDTLPVDWIDNTKENKIANASFFRKKVWDSIGGFNNIPCDDWDFWNRALKSRFSFMRANVVGYMFRMREGSLLRRQAGEFGFENIKKIIKESAESFKMKEKQC